MQENIKLVGNLIRREVMNLNELKKLAEAATPGPWSNRELENMEDCILSPDGETWVLYNDEISTMKQEDSDFVTAANPQQVLKMIECMELMAEALDNLVSQQPDPSFFPEEYMDANEALAAFDKLNEV